MTSTSRPPLAAKASDNLPPIDVWLNDQPMRDVVEYNETDGFVVCAKHDEFGNLMVSGEEFVTERIEGVVRVAWK